MKRSPKAKASPKKASSKKKSKKPEKTDEEKTESPVPPKKVKKGDGKGEKGGDGGGDGPKEKSFARRARPSTSKASQKWDAIRSAFNEEIRPQDSASSVHEDGNHLGQEIVFIDYK